MTPPPAVPTAETAFSHPPTVAAYRGLVRRRQLWLAGFVVASGTIIVGGEELPVADRAIPLFATMLLTAPVLVLMAALALIYTPRTARILRTYPWRAYPCRYPPRGQRRDFVMAVTVAPGREVLLHSTPYRCSLEHKRNTHPDTIWFAGDPEGGGVASPVGGHYPVRVVPTAMRDGQRPPLPPADALAESAGLAKDGRYLRYWF
ncbi:hypothetical protein ACQEVG_32425 [Streptomyces sp. CA-135486]|uniref:hypothetical protein n=1 Tax=Streptomyces sp. CA-135486 TaxID=3240049 RepID=UPI003D92B1CE